MNKSFLRLLAKTIIAMINANPRGYLSTQLELIQINLSVWEGIDVSPYTISRGLHNLAGLAIIDLLSPPIRGEQGQWHGRKLIIKATGKLYAYARQTYHSIKKFLRLTERARLLVEPTPTSRVLSVKSCTPTQYILSDVPDRRDPAFEVHFRAFKQYLGRL